MEKFLFDLAPLVGRNLKEHEIKNCVGLEALEV